MPDYYDTRGQILLRSGKFDQAVRDFDQALTLQPGMIGPLVGKAQAMSQSGKKTQAGNLLKQIDGLMTQPHDISAYSRKQLDGLRASIAE